MVDNYFVTDAFIDWDGNAGLGIIGTNPMNMLPKDITPFYLHKDNTNTTMKHTKAARFFDPIVAVKKYLRGFQRVHVSFQSTSSCNIVSVNTINECTNFVELREKGRYKHKQQWVIEMNHAQKFYLATHCCIDVLDGRIQHAHIFYIVWKYWHSHMNHCLDSTIASAYDIYLECCEGLLCTFWKLRIL